jgi:hypothetical protein
MVQAGVYSSLIHYFKALEALGGNPHDGRAVVAKMKEMPTDDPLFGKGSVRADGRKIHPAYLFEVKKPADSKYPWDYYNLVATIPADGSLHPAREERLPDAEEDLRVATSDDRHSALSLRERAFAGCRPLCGCPSRQARIQNIENNPCTVEMGLNFGAFRQPCDQKREAQPPRQKPTSTRLSFRYLADHAVGDRCRRWLLSGYIVNLVFVPAAEPLFSVAEHFCCLPRPVHPPTGPLSPRCGRCL